MNPQGIKDWIITVKKGVEQPSLNFIRFG